MRTPALALLLLTLAVLPAQETKPAKPPEQTTLEARGFVVTKQGNTTNIDAPGNLAPNKRFGGATLAEIDPENNPIDLALRANELFRTQPKFAYQLMLVATMRATFDMERVTDLTAHQAWSYVAGQPALNRILSWGRLSPQVSRTESDEVLQWAAKAGPPTYHPAWMIQHGMAVMKAGLDGTAPPAPLKAGFAPGEAWQVVLAKMTTMIANPAYWEKRRAAATPEGLRTRLEELKTQLTEALRTRPTPETRQAEQALAALAASFDEKHPDIALHFIVLAEEMNTRFRAAVSPPKAK
ncbi:MAG: hypothetical protein EBV31_07620 [Verrucomicrobia bacterium]|jgi:hypothetical protein|nr:hypothetical protein [Verrucomicrobiota bacterium]